MRKIIIAIAICMLVAATIIATSRTTAKASPDKKSASCFTMSADKYPIKAGADAPLVYLNADSDAVHLYAQFSLLTRDERVKLFSALNGTNKAKVWIVHIQNYLIDHDLNAEQQAFVNNVLAVLKGADFEANRAGIAAQLAGAKEQSIGLFGKEQAWELFVHLGGNSPFANNQQIARFVLPNSPNWNKPNCNCSTASDWCGYPGKDPGWCHGGQDCTVSSWGCGFLMAIQCDGLCLV